MKAAGYTYINIDDVWQKCDESVHLQPNPNLPDMKAVATYVHSRGLKLGILSLAGPIHDYEIRQPDKGKMAPYGVYDLGRNVGGSLWEWITTRWRLEISVYHSRGHQQNGTK